MGATRCDHKASYEEIYETRCRVVDLLTRTREKLKKARKIVMKTNMEFAPDRIRRSVVMKRALTRGARSRVTDEKSLVCGPFFADNDGLDPEATNAATSALAYPEALARKTVSLRVTLFGTSLDLLMVLDGQALVGEDADELHVFLGVHDGKR